MDSTVSVVDTLMTQRGVHPTSNGNSLPDNPLFKGVDPSNFAELTKALFGGHQGNQPPEQQKPDSDLDWLLKADRPVDKTPAANPQVVPPANNRPQDLQANYLANDQQRKFKANFSLYDDTITADGLSAAVADAYKPGGGLQAVTVPAEVLDAFKVGDFTGLPALLASTQQQAHANAMVGMMNMLNALLPQRLESLLNGYSSHADEVNARTSIAEQTKDPLLQLTINAALNEYKAKYPNATAAQLKAVSVQITEALKERLAPKADAKATAQPTATAWDEFLAN